MRKTAFIFSGQGSQYVGMGKELAEKFPPASGIFDKGSEILGFNLYDVISDEDMLKKTIYSQPAIYAVSLSAFYAAKETGITASAFAGHSLGEYAAMTAAGMLTPEEGFRAIKLRSEAMSRAAEKNPGGMVAVIGSEPRLIEKICEEVRNGGDYVLPVNYNSPVQTVIAGSENGLEKAIALLKENKARRIIKLAVEAAFHSEMMSEAAKEFKNAVKDFKFRTPSGSFYSNVTGKQMTDFCDMPEYLAKHICSPVQFTDELHTMLIDDIDTFIELGPGKVLTGLVKKTLTDIKTANIEDIKSLNEAKELLGL